MIASAVPITKDTEFIDVNKRETKETKLQDCFGRNFVLFVTFCLAAQSQDESDGHRPPLQL